MSLNSKPLANAAATVSVEKLLHPRSIAVVGVSAAPGSPGEAVVDHLRRFRYDGEIHLVSRNREEVNGIRCVPAIDDLPKGIDAVVLCVPQAAAVEAVRACARREAGAVMIFAAGFAEAGDEGMIAQQQITEIARENGMAVAGPNCMGLTNFIDRVPLTFAPGLKATAVEGQLALCVLTQSGGMMSSLRETSQARGIPLSYAISTGNEAAVGVEDYLAYLLDDALTRVVTMYVEHIRRPQLFLQLASKAREKGKFIVLLHPGKSEASKEAAQSHTGSLAGDYTVIQTLLEHEGVIMVDTMEELVDVAWFLTCYPVLPDRGTAIVTDSGAFKGFALDFCQAKGLELPLLSQATIEAIKPVLPEFTTATNPLDITAQALTDMSLYTAAAEAFLADAAVGSLLIAVLPGSPRIGLAKGRAALPAISGSRKPVAYVLLGEGSQLADELIDEMKATGVPLFRSAERAIRALACVTKAGIARSETGRGRCTVTVTPNPLPGTGALPEYLGKQYLAAAGIPVPAGELAADVEAACEIAGRIGYPVVIKISAGEIAHKSDIGGVIVGIGQESELREAWTRLHDNVQRAFPGLKPEGVLVEKMGIRGIEMVVGARRDPEWGPMVMVGLGGIWIEILKDVCFMPTDISEEAIVEKILTLRSSALLRGARGAKPSDLKALAKVVAVVAELMRTTPEVAEIDINPVIVYPDGEGVLALDALVVVSE